MRYEEVEHTADVRLKVYGADEKELFANAAFALFDMLVDLSGVQEKIREEVSSLTGGLNLPPGLLGL